MSGSVGPIRVVSTSVLFALALYACGDSSPTSTKKIATCGSTSVLTLDVFQVATVECSSGGAIQLGGNGARYVVVPEFAAGGVPNHLTNYVLSDSDAVATPEIVASRAPSAVATARARPHFGPGERQLRFDGALRAHERASVAQGRWTEDAASSGSSIRAAVTPEAAVVPAVGSVRSFHVISTFSANSTTFKVVNAKLVAVGTNTLVYLDTLSPPNGFTQTQLGQFSQSIDQTFYTMDVDAFGPPSDIDNNGRVIVLLTPVVNALSPSSQCQTAGFIAGFFDGFDLSGTGVNSNHGEIYYGIVPDPNGSVSCAHSVAEVNSIAPGTFLHEIQHLISYSQHVVIHGGSPEEGWLDEGLSIYAQELGSLFYEQKFPPPTGRTDPNQLLPDSAEGFIADQFVESFLYAERPDTATLTLHSDADGGLTWRAGDWLLAHWLGDQKGMSIYKTLDQSTLTGTANIAAAAGDSFQSLFGDFGLALYTDSIPGVPKSSIPQRDKFTTRTLREIWAAVGNSGAVGSAGDFPITLRTLSGTITASMLPGTVSYYQLVTAPSVGTTRMHFSSPGGSFATELNAQVSIMRIQ